MQGLQQKQTKLGRALMKNLFLVFVVIPLLIVQGCIRNVEFSNQIAYNRETQEVALDANEKLIKYLGDSLCSESLKKNFAGTYVDNEDLIVLLQNNDSDDVMEIKKILQEYENVFIREAELSYDELTAMCLNAVEILEKEYNVITYYVSVTTNSIEIEVLEKNLPDSKVLFAKFPSICWEKIHVKTGDMIIEE